MKGALDLEKLPKHLAIIMDGNGRWAAEKGKNRLFGHKNGVQSVRAIVEESARLGIQHLTLYAFFYRKLAASRGRNWNTDAIIGSITSQ